MNNEKLKKVSLLSASMVVTSWGAMNVNIPAMAKEFSDVPLPLVENLVTISSLFIMIAVLCSHSIAKKLGYKQTILIGIGTVAVSGLAPVVVNNFYLIFLSRALLGFGIGMFHALLVSMNKFFYEGEERTHMFGYQSAFEGFGGVTVTFAVGQLVKLGWQEAFYVYALAIPSFILFALFVPRVSTSTLLAKIEDVKPKSKNKGDFDIKSFIPILGYITLVFVLAAMYMILGIKMTTLMTSLGYGTATDGATILLMVGIGAMASGFLFGHVVKVAKDMTLIISYSILAVSMFVVGGSSSVLVTAMGGLFCGFSFRTIIPYLLNHVNSGAVKNSGLATSLLLVALNFGSFASPYGAIILEKLSWVPSMRGVFYIISAILAVFAIGTAFLKVLALKKEAVVEV